MRFGFLLAMMLMGGAMMGLALQVMVPSPSQNFIGGQGQVIGSAKIKFDISDLNPIKLIYDEVMKQVTTDANHPLSGVGTPVPAADFSAMDSQIRLNTEKFQGMNKSGNISALPESDPR